MLNTHGWPAHSADFLNLLWQATLQTLAMATAGMTLALLLAVPAALAACRSLSLSRLERGRMSPAAAGLRWLVRLLLIVLRSVPEIVWALLFVRAVGLGATAGVLAIAMTYSGMLGKVYAEILESVDARPAQALLGAGSSRLAAFCYGLLPNAATEMLSYTIYRWECALRASVVMGFVGAGGLGQQIELSLRMFATDEVISLLLTFIALTWLADRLSRYWREQLDQKPHRARWLPPLTLVIAALGAFHWLHIDWAELLTPSAIKQMGHYLGGFFPPEVSGAFLQRIGLATLTTLAMSAAGTLLAATAGALLALPAAGAFGQPLQMLARSLCNVLRSVPELVWAALMVLAIGLGPVAGALALALHTAGVLGRLFAEALENLPEAPAKALVLAGSGRVPAFCYGALPDLWPQWLAYALYRWENNIRMASILGLVGAGGLGQMLYVHLSLFQEPQAATVIAAMLVLVIVVDATSGQLRRRAIR